jgi:hypothetical protein
VTRQANLVHSVPGRVRLKIPSARGDHTYFEELGELLRQTEGVIGVLINVATGSVLIGHQWDSDQPLADLGRSSQLFELDSAALDPLWQRAAECLQHTHLRLSRLTRGELGIRSTLLLSLVAMGLVQSLRGQMMGPASTLLVEALKLVGVPEEVKRPLPVRPAGHPTELAESK